MKTHSPLILCAGRNRIFPNYTGKNTKSPYWSQQAEKYPVWFHYGGNVRLGWSFVAFVSPEMSRRLPSFTKFFSTLFYLNMAVGSLKHYSLPIYSFCEAVRDRDNCWRLSGRMFCWNRLWSTCAPLFMQLGIILVAVWREIIKHSMLTFPWII